MHGPVPLPSHARVAIIGGGQAGLAMARCLKVGGLEPLVLDAHGAVGDPWRRRYDSLKLFTPSQYSGLPGMPFPLPRDTYPTKDQVASYLVAYAKHFEIDVHLRSSVTRLTREGRHFRLEVNDSAVVMADVVVLATGTLQRPYTPSFANKLGEDVRQLHSDQYRNPTQLVPGDACVVGAGNSGAQIAEELSRNRRVYIAMPEMPKRFPQRLLGRDIFWWMNLLGMLNVPAEARSHAISGGAIPLIGTDLKALIRSGAVTRMPRAVDAEPGHLLFENGKRLPVRNVVWATGFTNAYNWVDVPGAIDRDMPRHHLGISVVHGLYFIGLPWLATKGSGFLGWVGRDAERLAAHILECANAA